MIAEIYNENGNFVGVYEIESLYKENVGGFPVWIVEGKTGKMALREGDMVYVLTITGKHLKTVTQPNPEGV